MYILSAKYSDDLNDFFRHFHDAHELLYVISGSISVNVGGEEVYEMPDGWTVKTADNKR